MDENMQKDMLSAFDRKCTAVFILLKDKKCNICVTEAGMGEDLDICIIEVKRPERNIFFLPRCFAFFTFNVVKRILI